MGCYLVTICDDILADQNDINEHTRAQLDAISEALLKRSRWLLLSLFALFVGASPTFMGIKYNG